MASSSRSTSGVRAASTRPAGRGAVPPRPRPGLERPDCGTASPPRSPPQGHPTFAVDLRGHGRSSKPDGPYDVATVADDLAALIERLGLDRPVVAGQSWGGNVVLELAARHPGASRGIVLRGRRLARAEPRLPGLGGLPGGARPAPAGRPAAATRSRATSARRHPDWPESGIRGHAGQLRGPRRRDDRPVAHLRAPHRPSCAGCGSTTRAARTPALAVPVLLAPAAEWTRRDWTRRKRQAVEAARGGHPERPGPLVHRRPRHPRPAPGRTRRRDARHDDRRVLRDDAARGSSRSWAPARPRRRWPRSTARSSSGSAPEPVTGRDPRHAVRVPGERRRAERSDASSSSPRASGARWPSPRTGRATSTRSRRPRPSPGSARRATSWPARAAPATPSASGPAARSRPPSPIELRDGGILTMASAAALTLGIAHDPRLRDLQGGRGAALAAGARPAGSGDRPAGRRGPPLRQRRGRQPRHPLLLHGRAPPADAGARAGRRARSSWASTATRRSCSTSIGGTATVSGLGGVTVRVDGRRDGLPERQRGEHRHHRRDVARGLADGQTADIGWEPGPDGAGRLRRGRRAGSAGRRATPRRDGRARGDVHRRPRRG